MVSSIQKEKAERFLKYHYDNEILVLLNTWDVASSKIVEASGFKAIATTSMGIAELQDLGVARLSLGSGLMKATLSLIKKVADELSEYGTYNTLTDTLTPLPNAASAYKMAIR